MCRTLFFSNVPIVNKLAKKLYAIVSLKRVAQIEMAPYYDLFETPIGWIAASVSNIGLRSLSLHKTMERGLASVQFGVAKTDPALSATLLIRDLIKSYFRRDFKALDKIPLDLTGTSPFYKRIWLECRNIPAGETRTYGSLSAIAGLARGARAAGKALANNPILIVIPCHRVVHTTGALGGYSAGTQIKRNLLSFESMDTL